MKMKNWRFTLIEKTYFDSEIPLECPYCGSYLTPQVIGYTYGHMEHVYLFYFHNDCCDKPTYALYDVHIGNRVGKFLSLYPAYEKKATLPESLSIISPRFVELYNNCYFAEQKGFLELAGSGYRNALEVLIKDYAVKELNKPEDEVCKVKLGKAIEFYMPNLPLKQTADVIRILGNDYTHYQRHFEDLDFQHLKNYLDIFINHINTLYLINHPIVPTNRTVQEE